MQHDQMLLSSVLEAIRETYQLRNQVQKRAIKIGLDAAALLPSCWGYSPSPVNWGGELPESLLSSSTSAKRRLRIASYHSDVDEGEIHRLLSQESNRSLSYSEDSVADEEQLQPPLLPQQRHSLFSASNESVDTDADHPGMRMPAAALVSGDDTLVIAQGTCEAVATVAAGMF